MARHQLTVRTATTRAGGAVLLAALAIGCAAHSPHDRDFVSESLRSRTGHSLRPGGPGPSAVPPGVDVADGLSEDEAVAAALWNNPDLELALAELGLARADLVEAGLIKNPIFSLLFPIGPKQLEFTLTWPLERSGSGRSGWPPPARRPARRRPPGAERPRPGARRARGPCRAAARGGARAARAGVARGPRAHRHDRGGAAAARRRLGARDGGGAHRRGARAGRRPARRARAESARERLRALLGLAADGLAAATPPPRPPSSRELHALLKQAFAARPELRAAELGMEAAGRRASPIRGADPRRAARRQRLGQAGLRDGPRVALELPLFGRNEGRLARAQAELELESRRYMAVRERIGLEVRQARVALLEARESLPRGSSAWRPRSRRACASRGVQQPARSPAGCPGGAPLAARRAPARRRGTGGGATGRGRARPRRRTTPVGLPDPDRSRLTREPSPGPRGLRARRPCLFAGQRRPRRPSHRRRWRSQEGGRPRFHHPDARSRDAPGDPDRGRRGARAAGRAPRRRRGRVVRRARRHGHCAAAGRCCRRRRFGSRSGAPLARDRSCCGCGRCRGRLGARRRASKRRAPRRDAPSSSWRPAPASAPSRRRGPSWPRPRRRALPRARQRPVAEACWCSRAPRTACSAARRPANRWRRRRRSSRSSRATGSGCACPSTRATRRGRRHEGRHRPPLSEPAARTAAARRDRRPADRRSDRLDHRPLLRDLQRGRLAASGPARRGQPRCASPSARGSCPGPRWSSTSAGGVGLREHRAPRLRAAPRRGAARDGELAVLAGGPAAGRASCRSAPRSCSGRSSGPANDVLARRRLAAPARAGGGARRGAGGRRHPDACPTRPGTSSPSSPRRWSRSRPRPRASRPRRSRAWSPCRSRTRSTAPPGSRPCARSRCSGSPRSC